MHSNVNDIVSKNVKAYREAAGYSQSVLAQKAYIPLETVEKTEQGRGFSNKYYYLMKIPNIINKNYGTISALNCFTLIVYSFVTYTTDNTADLS